MALPSRKEIDSVLEKAEGTLSLAANPTPLQKLRWDICQKFIKFKRQNELSQKELARMVGVDDAKISKILHHRISEFSTDRLISLYGKINPRMKLKIS
ncbi:MAG TPA: XRE family transcriptional regulator [Pseudobdellovibrionaceae bacterium]|nr:XRE family transcriptional regulator [Pseudobdellovibrionaceae bacterium]